MNHRRIEGRKATLAAATGGGEDNVDDPATPPLLPAWATAPAVACLPIAPALPAITAHLASNPVLVLEAAPGAGKTTTVPLALALGMGVRVLVVEPRRLAARAAARRMAGLLGERVGERVGFRVRGQARVSAQTVVEVVTPGLALRALAGAAAAAAQAQTHCAASTTSSTPPPPPHRVPLARFGAVILDEVHERGIETDACLALLAAHSPLRAARPDLRVVAASATLGGGLAGRVAGLLSGGGGSGGGGGPAPPSPSILTLPEGRAFPVRTLYAGPPAGSRDRDLAAAVVGGLSAGWAALGGTSGDALVFLPGAREIRACQAALAASALASFTVVLPLYGALPAADQDAALRPGPPGDGRRRVILSTPVAESSLTVPGVRLVVDAGLARTPAADAGSGLDKLVTGPIPQASADQRRGRAGRTAPGVCVRLWTEASHARRPAGGVPAVLRSDYAPTALVLARVGLADAVGGLAWLDAPPPGARAAATRLLYWLGALVEGGGAAAAPTLTPAGAAMAALGAHPRLGRMLLVAADLGVPELGAVVAALVSAGRDILPRPVKGGAGHALGADLGVRVLALAGAGPGAGLVDGRAARSVLDDAGVLYGQLRRVVAGRRLGAAEGSGEAEAEDDGDDEAGGGVDTTDEEGEEEEGAEPPGDPGQNNLLPCYGRGPAARAGLAAAAAAQAGHASLLLGALLASAYPDRVAVRRGRSNRARDTAFDLGGWEGGEGGGGSAARLPDPDDPLQSSPLLAVAALATSAPGRSPVILAAAPVDADHPATASIPGLVVREARAEWVTGGAAATWVLAARRVVRLGGAVAAEEAVDPSSLGAAALEAAAVVLAGSVGLAACGAPPAFLAARARAAWWHASSGGGSSGGASSAPDLSEAALAASLPAWLPGLRAARTGADLASLPWVHALAALLTPDVWAEVDRAAPGEWEAAPGVRVGLCYADAPPVALVPLDVAFEAGLATGAPPPPAVGVALVLPGDGSSSAQPLAQAPSLEALWKEWPRVRAALRRRPGGGSKEKKDWPELAPGGLGAGVGTPAAGGAAKGKKKKGKR